MISAVQIKDPLQGLRVLIVEDESLVAMLVEEFLSELGCVVAGSVRRVARAFETLASTDIDAAILDLNVAGEQVLPVADALVSRGIPFIFASGYGEKGVDPDWSKHPMLQKPFTSEELRDALVSALSRCKDQVPSC